MSIFEKIQNRRSLWSDVASGSSSSRTNTVTEESKESAPFPPPRARRTAGWSDESSKSSKSRSSSTVAELDRFKSPERLTIIDSDDDIPAIPDLEEMQDDYSKDIVTGTSIAVTQVAKYKEPDTDLLKHPTFAGYEDGMLRLLTKGMNSENEVKEGDTPLTWQQLFTEISSESSS